jgi:hypothetical protein
LCVHSFARALGCRAVQPRFEFAHPLDPSRRAGSARAWRDPRTGGASNGMVAYTSARDCGSSRHRASVVFGAKETLLASWSRGDARDLPVIAVGSI